MICLFGWADDDEEKEDEDGDDEGKAITWNVPEILKKKKKD